MSCCITLCLPTYNSMPWLDQRVSSILQQTRLPDEIVVLDGESKDGTCEYLINTLGALPGFRLLSRPPEGIYPAFNEAVLESSGAYIYIATSDDDMAPDCLEKMSRALDLNPACGIAHCMLKASGESAVKFQNTWENHGIFSTTAKDMFYKPHIRDCPVDGLVHMFGHSVYISMTQLMIRKSVFDQVGFFETKWGSMGDFHWNCRACLHTSTVHVPDTWGGWRIHESQASSIRQTETMINAKREMFLDALNSSNLEKNLEKFILSLLNEYDFIRKLQSEKNPVLKFYKGLHNPWLLAMILYRKIKGEKLDRDYFVNRIKKISQVDLHE